MFALKCAVAGGRMLAGAHSLMKTWLRGFAAVLLAGCLAIPSVAQKEKTVAEHAAGGFDVKVDAQGEADKAAGSTLARYSLDKQYHGDLDATSKGTMLT